MLQAQVIQHAKDLQTEHVKSTDNNDDVRKFTLYHFEQF